MNLTMIAMIINIVVKFGPVYMSWLFHLSEMSHFSKICLFLENLYKFINASTSGVGQPALVRSVGNINGICVRWEADYPCTFDHVGCLNRMGWKSPFYACVNNFGVEPVFLLQIENSQRITIKRKRTTIAEKKSVSVHNRDSS